MNPKFAHCGAERSCAIGRNSAIAIAPEIWNTSSIIRDPQKSSRLNVHPMPSPEHFVYTTSFSRKQGVCAPKLVPPNTPFVVFLDTLLDTEPR